MKKAVVFLILVLGWSSCTKEESLGVGYPPLVGTWKLVQKNVLNDSVYVLKTIENPALHTLTFASDGTVSVSYTHLDVYKRQTVLLIELETPSAVGTAS